MNPFLNRSALEKSKAGANKCAYFGIFGKHISETALILDIDRARLLGRGSDPRYRRTAFVWECGNESITETVLAVLQR